MTAKVWWISYTPMSLSDTSPPPLTLPLPACASGQGAARALSPLPPTRSPNGTRHGPFFPSYWDRPASTPALQPLLLCARTTARKRPNTQHPHGGGGLVPIGTGRLTPPAMPALYHTHLYGFARVP
jgi:hypothetical protein